MLFVQVDILDEEYLPKGTRIREVSAMDAAYHNVALFGCVTIGHFAAVCLINSMNFIGVGACGLAIGDRMQANGQGMYFFCIYKHARNHEPCQCRI